MKIKLEEVRKAEYKFYHLLKDYLEQENIDMRYYTFDFRCNDKIEEKLSEYKKK